VIWTAVWAIYHLAFARRRFTHGHEWRSQEDTVAAQTADAADPPSPDPRGIPFSMVSSNP